MQQAALATLIDEGPVKAGFSGACWRSPMIQQLIYDRFGVFYNVFYIAQLLKNLGFSFQKAAFVSIIWMKPSGKRGAPPRGRTFFVSRQRGMPCCCLAMKRRSRSGARSRIRGRGAVSSPRSRLVASAKAIKSSA